MWGLFVLLLVSFTAPELFEVEPIDGPIYLEHLGEVAMYHQTWTVVNYVDLTELNVHRDQLYTISEALSKVCNSTNDKTTKGCLESPTIEVIRQRLDRIDNRRARLMNIINYVPRSKRGVFDFVGDISKVLFGTLGNSDAEYYNQEIDKIHDDNERLSVLVRNQTTIVKGIISSFSDSIQSLSNDTQKLSDGLYKTAILAKDNTQNIAISSQVALLETLIDEYSENLNNILNAVNDGKQGIVHPQILSPTDLIKALHLIRDRTISGDMPPLPLEEGAFAAIITISDVNVVINNNRFSYVIKVPVVENSILNAYRLIPVLQRKSQSTTFYYLNPPDSVVITNDARTLFTPSNDDELDKCKKLGSKFLCKRKNPDYAMNNPNSCEAVILQRPTDISDSQCQTLFIKLVKSLWIQLKNGNTWIVTSPVEEMLHLSCNDRRMRQTILRGTNKVTISEDCLGHTEHVFIRPSHETKIAQTTDVMLNKALVTPMLDNLLNNHSILLDDLQLTTLGRPTHVDVTQLKSLGQTLDEISEEAEKIGRHRRNKTLFESAQTGFTYLGYACIFIIIVLIAFKLGLCGCLFGLFSRLLSFSFSPCVNIYNNCFHSNNTNHTDYTVSYIPEEIAALTNVNRHNTVQPAKHPNRRRISYPKA